MKTTVNMLSSAYKVKGQGVASAYTEQVALVKNIDKYKVTENKMVFADITHFHTVDLKHRIFSLLTGIHGINIGYVHFLPETLEGSIKLPWIAKKVFYRYLLSFYKSMDFLVTVNPYFVEKLEELGIAKEKIAYIPNFVAEETFHKISREEVQKTKEKYNIAKDKFVVLAVGQLQTRKGVLDFCKIAREMPECEFVWAGGFSFGNVTEGCKEIQKEMQKAPQNMHFLGIIERSHMNAIYNACDVMFLPSYNELFPMTILEAMCVGKPLLLRDIPLYKNILEGCYEKAKDNAGFAKKIHMLQTDKEAYKKAVAMSAKGKRMYSKENVSRMWDSYYASCIAKKKGVVTWEKRAML